MTGTIWKFDLRETLNDSDGAIAVPRGTRLLSAGWDPKVGICAWGEVPDKTAPKEKVRLHIVGTGHDLPDEPARFLGTAIMLDTGLVFHIYVVDPRPRARYQRDSSGVKP